MQRVSEEGIRFGTYLWQAHATVDFKVWAGNMIEALEAGSDDLPQHLIDHLTDMEHKYEEETGLKLPFNPMDPESLERAVDAAMVMSYLITRTGGDTYAASIGARDEIPDDLCIRYSYDETGILAYMVISSFAPDGNAKLCPFYLYAEAAVDVSENEEVDAKLLIRNHRADLEELDAAIRSKARILGINARISNSWLR